VEATVIEAALDRSETIAHLFYEKDSPHSVCRLGILKKDELVIHERPKVVELSLPLKIVYGVEGVSTGDEFVSYVINDQNRDSLIIYNGFEVGDIFGLAPIDVYIDDDGFVVHMLDGTKANNTNDFYVSLVLAAVLAFEREDTWLVAGTAIN
jgi:hypothetical protein